MSLGVHLTRGSLREVRLTLKHSLSFPSVIHRLGTGNLSTFPQCQGRVLLYERM